jgi:hypothetical protein
MTNALPLPQNAPQPNSFAAALSRLLATTAALWMDSNTPAAV